MEIEKEIKEKIIGILKVLFPKARIILFGSRATGKQHTYSDIDLAIDAGKSLPRVDIDEAKSVMTELNIPYKVDIVDFHNITDLMQEQIKKDGILWNQ